MKKFISNFYGLSLPFSLSHQKEIALFFKSIPYFIFIFAKLENVYLMFWKQFSQIDVKSVQKFQVFFTITTRL